MPKLHHPLVQFGADVHQRLLHLPLRDDIVLGREDENVRFLGEDFAGGGMDEFEAVDGLAEELDADGELLVGGEDLDDVATHAILAALEVDLAAAVLHVGEAEQEFAAVDVDALLQRDHAVAVIHRRTQAEDARHRRDDDHVLAAEQVARRGETQPIQIVVARRILLDVNVPLRNVRFGLVIVVITDEVTHRIVRKKFLHLFVQLSGEGFVVADDQ